VKKKSTQKQVFKKFITILAVLIFTAVIVSFKLQKDQQRKNLQKKPIGQEADFEIAKIYQKKADSGENELLYSIHPFHTPKMVKWGDYLVYGHFDVFLHNLKTGETEKLADLTEIRKQAKTKPTFPIVDGTFVIDLAVAGDTLFISYQNGPGIYWLNLSKKSVPIKLADSEKASFR